MERSWFARWEELAFSRLRRQASAFRLAHIRKPVGRGNVAAVGYFGCDSTREQVVATSRAKPVSIPKPKSEGGHFEPGPDPISGREKMDTDAEYKVLSGLADRLNALSPELRVGVVLLFTELQPCGSCESVLSQFRAMFPWVVVVVRFEYPYPFKS